MSQAGPVNDLDQAVGYVLKQAAAALRAAMDAVLRPLAQTVPQYACLELLGRRPGLAPRPGRRDRAGLRRPAGGHAARW